MRTGSVRLKPMRCWARSNIALKIMFHSVAMAENISVSAPMWPSGLPIAQASSGAQMITAISSKSTAWNSRSFRDLVGDMWESPGRKQRVACILIGR
ncbi:hypothetical protein D9M70_206770 [compost metagenome]